MYYAYNGFSIHAIVLLQQCNSHLSIATLDTILRGTRSALQCVRGQAQRTACTTTRMTSLPKSRPLFGPPRAWRDDDFVASDDRVRGGSSQSYLTPSATLTTARFHGVLDTTTLGGAGFASQRTATSKMIWNLSEYNGIELSLAHGDGKKYTLNIKTVLPDKMDNGRDASTVEYAFSFIAPNEPTKIFAKWEDFKPFYRGKPVEDAKPLDTSSILRWSLMMRSFFEQQQGPFSVTIRSIKARKEASEAASTVDEKETEDSDWDDCSIDEKAATNTTTSEAQRIASTPMRFCAIL